MKLPSPFPSGMLVLAALALSGGWAGPTAARPDPQGELVEIPVHLPPAPAISDTVARRSIARLGKAALLACGGSEDSVPPMKIAVRASACWHQAMNGAITRIGDARLSAWWAAHPL
jgi:hypothetical protein